MGEGRPWGAGAAGRRGWMSRTPCTKSTTQSRCISSCCGRIGTGVQVPPGPGDPGGSTAEWRRGCPGVSIGHREGAWVSCHWAAWPAAALPLYCHQSAVDLEGGPCSQELTALEASRKPAATRQSLRSRIQNVPPKGLVRVGCGPTARSVRKTGQGSGVLPTAGQPPGAGRAWEERGPRSPMLRLSQGPSLTPGSQLKTMGHPCCPLLPPGNP